MKQLNRWVYAIVGVIVLLFAGLVYAWSVLSTPIGTGPRLPACAVPMLLLVLMSAARPCR